MTMSLSRGRSRSMFFRLWVRAPRILMLSMGRLFAKGQGASRGSSGLGGTPVRVLARYVPRSMAARDVHAEGGTGNLLSLGRAPGVHWLHTFKHWRTPWPAGSI